MIVVLFGFLGLGIDSGHAYLDRRELQSGVDAAALAAAYNYMNNGSYALAEQAATATYASNQRLYASPACSGYGTQSVTCSFGDPTGQTLTQTVAGASLTGLTFQETASHRIGVFIMQVLGTAPTIPISATATALARRPGTNGAAIQTLSPVCGGAGISLAFTGTSTTTVTGDIWADGGIVDSGGAGGTVNGNAIDVCPAQPPVPLPAAKWTVTGLQANGWNMPDPDYAEPALNTQPETWNSTNGATQTPGMYSSATSLTTSSCYFMAGGEYDFAAGFKLNGGFVSNELRPPGEPMLTASNGQAVPVMTTVSAALSGTITAIPVASLAAALVPNQLVSAGGQTFTVAKPGAAASGTATSIPVASQAVSGTIASGSTLTVRSFYQFWDANGVGCSAGFSVSANGSDSSNPPVNAQTWALELTAVRWTPNGVSSCTGPASPSCYLRESAPSTCRTVTIGPSQVIKVAVSGPTSPPDPGAQYFNVYLDPSGTCQGPFGFVTTFANNSPYSANVNGSVLAGWTLSPTATLDTPGAPPPDLQGLPLGPGLPNSNPPTPAGTTPPHGDLANESHCVDPLSGSNVACASAFTPGAVSIFIPGPGSNTQCLNLQGGGDVYLFSGYQFNRVLLYEPGPKQAPPPNTCPNNVAGSGLTSLIGIFYLPAATITIVGNSSYLATIAGGVIAWSASVKGNGGVSISADPTLRHWPPTVRLIQ